MENEWRKVKTSFSSPSFWQIEEKVFTLQRKFEIRKMKKNEEKFLDSMGNAGIPDAVHDYEMGDVKEMKCVFDKKTSNVVMRYPDSMYMENEDGMGRWFDPAKLTDAQIEQMLQTLSLKKRARRVRCDCLIPEGNGERNVYYLKY